MCSIKTFWTNHNCEFGHSVPCWETTSGGEIYWTVLMICRHHSACAQRLYPHSSQTKMIVYISLSKLWTPSARNIGPQLEHKHLYLSFQSKFCVLLCPVSTLQTPKPKSRESTRMETSSLSNRLYGTPSLWVFIWSCKYNMSGWSLWFLPLCTAWFKNVCRMFRWQPLAASHAVKFASRLLFEPQIGSSSVSPQRPNPWQTTAKKQPGQAACLERERSYETSRRDGRERLRVIETSACEAC